jgi:hypothetical protein
MKKPAPKRKAPPLKTGAPGRPKLDIDPAQVEALARIACTTPEIATVIGCSEDTLERRFAGVIEKGRAEGKASVRRMQYKAAMSGNPTMLIWLGKVMLGQKEAVEHGGIDGAAIKHEVTVHRVDRPIDSDQ